MVIVSPVDAYTCLHSGNNLGSRSFRSGVSSVGLLSRYRVVVTRTNFTAAVMLLARLLGPVPTYGLTSTDAHVMRASTSSQQQQQQQQQQHAKKNTQDRVQATTFQPLRKKMTASLFVFLAVVLAMASGKFIAKKMKTKRHELTK